MHRLDRHLGTAGVNQHNLDANQVMAFTKHGGADGDEFVLSCLRRAAATFNDRFNVENRDPSGEDLRRRQAATRQGTPGCFGSRCRGTWICWLIGHPRTLVPGAR